MSNNSATANVNNVATETFGDKAKTVASTGFSKFKSACASEPATQFVSAVAMGAGIAVGVYAVTAAYNALTS